MKNINRLNEGILDCDKRMKDLANLIDTEKNKIENDIDSLSLEEIKSKKSMIESFEVEFKEVYSERKSLELQVENLKEEIKGLDLASTGNSVVKNETSKLKQAPEFLEAWSKAVHGDSSDYQKMLMTTDAGMDGVIPTYVEDSIERKIAEIGGLFNHATHLNIRGIMTMSVEVSSTGAVNHAEGAAAPEEEEISLESLVVKPEMIKKWISYTDELEALSGVDLVDYLVNEFIEKHILKIEQDMLNGADNNKGLTGIYTLANAGSDFVNKIDGAGELTFGHILQMLAETKGSNLKWFMTRNTFYTKVMGLVDTAGQPIFKVVGDNSGKLMHTLYGYPVEFEEVMANGDMILQNYGAYKTNTPNGVTPMFTLDRITKSKEDKVELVGKTLIGGRPVKLEQTSVFFLGTPA